LKALIIGSGAREHALTWKVAQSKRIKELFVAPGNAGTAKIATNIPVNANDIQNILNVAREKNIDITVVGPEIPLSLGIVDLFQEHGLAIFGATKAAAQLESSKVFSKTLMEKYKIPCADSSSFTDIDSALRYLNTHELPVVIKADGLAAGKGVIIASALDEAEKAVTDIMGNKIFGASGDKILIEEFLTGKEVSLLAFTDGKTVIPMVPACDYKRVFDNDLGPNTGGMGSYSPPGFFDDKMIEQVTDTILKPTIEGMRQEGIIYKSVLYAGLMITDKGPKVLEYNARFGDPETQAILPRLESDIVDIFEAVINNSLDKMKIKWSSKPCIGVVLASGGYPGSYKTGYPISGLNSLDKNIIVFHASDKLVNTEVVTDGGRVLTVVASGKTLKYARDIVYKNIPRITFADSQFRSDIALREVK
jgi:phosphoribosylamine---glycine ligase